MSQLKTKQTNKQQQKALGIVLNLSFLGSGSIDCHQQLDILLILFKIKKFVITFDKYIDVKT